MQYLVFSFMTGIIYFWNELGIRLTHNSKLGEYRHLQILESLLNDTVRHRIFPVQPVIFPMAQILGGFAIIKLHKQLNPFHLAFVSLEFPTLVLVNSIIFVGCGMIHSKSLTWLKRSRQTVSENQKSKNEA